MHKIAKITPASGNPPKPQEPPQAKTKEKTDKPFCFVLNDTIIEQAVKKAYPNMR